MRYARWTLSLKETNSCSPKKNKKPLDIFGERGKIPIMPGSGVKKGLSSEALASQWLRKKGYIILGRNRLIGDTQVDILALNQNPENTYHFIEIKTVKTENFYAGYPPWNARQAARYHKAIHSWYSELEKAVPVRISLLLLDPEGSVLRFYPDYHFPMAS